MATCHLKRRPAVYIGKLPFKTAYGVKMACKRNSPYISPSRMRAYKSENLVLKCPVESYLQEKKNLIPVVGREILLIGSAASQTHSLLITHRYKHKSSSLTS